MINSTLILEALRAKGIDFLFLGLAVMYFYTENQEVKAQATACASAHIEFVKQENNELKVILQRNTVALEKILEKL